jgi:hypothetical protein
MNFNKRPVYSFGKRTYATNKSCTPGPNQYDIRSKFEGGYSFGREFRQPNTNMQDKYNVNPGVGSYRVDKNLKNENPKYSFGGKGIGGSGYYDKSAGMPGPGNYNPKHKFKSLSYSISTKHNNGYSNNPEEPGPGAYLLNTGISKYGHNRFNAPEYSFGTNRKDGMYDPLIGSKTPGPGTYARGDDNTVKNKAPTFSFANEDRNPNTANFNPGPGDYDPTNSAGQFDNAPKYSLGKSSGLNYALNNSSRIPGPGTYQLNDKNKKRYPGVVMGSEPRLNSSPNDNPGPGNYNNHTRIEVQKQSAPKFR